LRRGCLDQLGSGLYGGRQLNLHQSIGIAYLSPFRSFRIRRELSEDDRVVRRSSARPEKHMSSER
jgi:hypothetical protein